MYTKEQLEKLAIPELMEIANQLGVKVSQNDTMENVIYEILDKALRELPEREEKVIRLRFGFDDGNPLTLEQVGQIMSII